MKFLSLLRPVLCLASIGCAVTPLRADPPKIVESPTAATAGKATLVISESDKTQSVEAQGRDVAIEGSHNKIVLTGECHALTINGNGNEVKAEAVATVSTPGNQNKVTWTKVVDGEKPQITNLGNDNTLGKRAE